MCMYECVLCMCLRVYVFACAYLHMHLYTCVCVYVFVCMYLLPLVAAEPHGWILDPVTKAGVNLPALIMKIYNDQVFWKYNMFET